MVERDQESQQIQLYVINISSILTNIILIVVKFPAVPLLIDIIGVKDQLSPPIINKKSHIHSIVEFIDGNIMFSGSENDMKIPIGYSLSYPSRLKSYKTKFSNNDHIELIRVNEKSYKAFSLARKALNEGGSMPAVMNAANNIAVESFLKRKIKFTDILNVVENVMKKHKVVKKFNLKKIIDINEKASKHAYNIVNQ